MCRKGGLEPGHDAYVPSPGSCVPIRVGGGQAVHERIEHSMLDVSHDLLLPDELRLGFSKTTGLRMQAREVRNGA
jgi:hypothetical protein